MKIVTLYFNDSYTAPELTDEPILCITKNKKMMTFKNVSHRWEWMVEKYQISLWTYQRNITL